MKGRKIYWALIKGGVMLSALQIRVISAARKKCMNRKRMFAAAVAVVSFNLSAF